MCVCVLLKIYEYFTVEDEVIRQCRRFNAEERRLTVRIPAPTHTTSAADQDPTQYFADSVDELFEYSLRDLDPSDTPTINRTDRSA